jgi:predicted ATPase
MVASERDKDSLPQNTLPVNAPGMEDMRALKAAVIYGANASGKSNLIQALSFLRSFVLDSARLLPPKQPTGVIPFLSEKGVARLPTELEVDFVHLGTHYRFKVVLTSKQVLEEVLEVYPDGRKQTWYRRYWDAETNQFRYEPEYSSVFKRDPKQEEFTRPNALFLSTAVQLNNAQLQPVVDWFRTQLRFNLSEFPSPRSSRSPDFPSTARCLEAGGPMADRLQQLLKSADFGIAGARVWESQVEYDEKDEDSGQIRNFTQDHTQLVPPPLNLDLDSVDTSRPLNVTFRHAGPGGSEFELPLEAESAGTRKFFALAGPWLQALDQGVTLFLDEFDTSLHPFLTQALLELVFKPEHNPKGAQVIFTTHNPLLLDPTFLRRDQIWFVDKDNESGTFVYPLTDYKPRREESLLRGYLSGRYGALPFIPRGLMNSDPETISKEGAHGG